MVIANAFNLFYPLDLVICFCAQETVAGMVEDEALIDYPPLLMNAGSLKVGAQSLCLQHGCGLRQGDDDKFRLALRRAAWEAVAERQQVRRPRCGQSVGRSSAWSRAVARHALLVLCR